MTAGEPAPVKWPIVGKSTSLATRTPLAALAQHDAPVPAGVNFLTLSVEACTFG